MTSIDQLIAFTARAAPYTADNYPMLGKLEGQDVFAFKLSHSMRHVGKTAGRIDTMLEAYDHGAHAALNRDRIKEQVTKQVFNALRLAELMGISGREIKASFEKDFPIRS